MLQIIIVLSKDLRLLRVLHYWLTFCFGMAIAALQTNLPPMLLKNFFLSTLSIFSASVFAIIQNNIADQKIDAISNPSRPLITKSIALPVYRQVGYLFLCIALLSAWQINYPALFIIANVSINYTFYSQPPLRLKRILFLSKLIIGVNFLLLFLLGYTLIERALHFLPMLCMPIFLLGFSSCAHLIDIKDVAGDLADNIKTLPNYFGMTFSKFFISVAFVLTDVSFYFLFNERQTFLLIGLIATAMLQVYYLYKNPYAEKPLLVINALSTASLVIFLFAMRPALLV